MATDGMVRCVIVGSGGHARVVIDALRMRGGVELCGALDADRSLHGQQVLGVPILGGDELLPVLVRQGISHFVVGLGGVGDNGPRRRLFTCGLEHGLEPLSVLHPSAVHSHWAQIGDGSVVCPAAVINAGAVLGMNVIVNTGAIVEHDCVVGDHAHIATGARLSGTVRIGAAAHIGAGATVQQGLSVGEGAIVGVGAVVVRDVEPWTVVAGVPARVLERLRTTMAVVADLPSRRTIS